MTKQKMLQKVGVEDAKDGTAKQDDWKEKGKRKRTLDFAQFTDWVVANNITNEAEFWRLAGKEKEEHRGTVGTEEQWVQRNRGHRGTVSTEEQ